MEDAQEFVIESLLWTQIDGAPSSSRSPSFQYLFFALFHPFLCFNQFPLVSRRRTQFSRCVSV